jgi:hypothetical protein
MRSAHAPWALHVGLDLSRGRLDFHLLDETGATSTSAPHHRTGTVCAA